MYTAVLQHDCLLYEFQAPLINCKLHEAARDFIFVGLIDHLTAHFVCSLLYSPVPITLLGWS